MRPIRTHARDVFSLFMKFGGPPKGEGGGPDPQDSPPPRLDPPLGGGGVKPPIHFYCVLHAKRGGGDRESMYNCILN